MALVGGFYSPEHEEHFREARRGGADSKICGVRTRGGGVCRHPPLQGGRRCLRHAGPAAARAHRDRQLHDLALGRITVEAFARAEARRAANRLRYEWKKNPWHPGRTIDLGTHEDRFRIESGIARLPARVAPAVLDWLRWKYRRLRIDRRRDEDWSRVLREDYPRRVRDAGPEPRGVDVDRADLVQAPLWTIEREGRTTSKRQRLDNPRAAPERKGRTLKEREMPGQIDQTAISLMVVEHRDTLGPLLDMCRSEGEQRTVILALRDYLADPQSAGCARRWQDAVTALWDRAGMYGYGR